LVVENPSQLKKADVVLVTDGFAEAAAAPALREQAREMGVTVLGVGIGVGSEALAPWCDQYVSVERLDTIDEKTAEQVFTI
jgi:UDP-N-acetyl-D-mannosaminuronic acid transferase (WecB/TagA/CpsF family)